LGYLLDFCEDIETGNMPAIQEKLHAHPRLNMNTLNAAQLEALSWANSITI